MKGPPAPLRFLILVGGGWMCLRLAFVAPGWWAPIEPALAEDSLTPAPDIASARPLEVATGPDFHEADQAASARRYFDAPNRKAGFRFASAPPVASPPLAPPLPSPRSSSPIDRQARAPRRFTATPAAISPPSQKRWSGSAWLFLREGGGNPIAPGGTLGGSQAGARLLYAIEPRLAVSARAYSPLRRTEEAEVALGLDWHPIETLPVRILAERRIPLSASGRSAFALTAYGGIDNQPIGPLQLDAYGQAGTVGRGDLFADGAARLGVPTGAATIGVGLWGAAQPGVERLDIGPQISVALPASGGTIRVSADWRFRVAGDARPDSGPSLTVSAGF